MVCQHGNARGAPSSFSEEWSGLTRDSKVHSVPMVVTEYSCAVASVLKLAPMDVMAPNSRGGQVSMLSVSPCRIGKLCGKVSSTNLGGAVFNHGWDVASYRVEVCEVELPVARRICG